MLFELYCLRLNASLLIVVAADLRAATERCNRSDIALDLSVTPSINMADVERPGATF